MAVESLDVPDLLRKHLEQDSPDVEREMVRAFAEQMMSAKAGAMCGADYGERSAERVNWPYRSHRPLELAPSWWRFSLYC